MLIALATNELKTVTITAYMNLQRLKASTDIQKEIANQECELKAKLEALGIVVDNLKIQ